MIDWERPGAAEALMLDPSDTAGLASQVRFVPWRVPLDGQFGVSVTPTVDKAAAATWLLKDPQGTTFWVEQSQSGAGLEFLESVASQTDSMTSSTLCALSTGDEALLQAGPRTAAATLIRNGLDVTVVGPTANFTAAQAFALLDEIAKANTDSTSGVSSSGTTGPSGSTCASDSAAAPSQSCAATSPSASSPP